MARIKSFDDYSREYDDWYTENYNIYISELNAIRSFIPPGLYGVEIGVGTGRFAVPLGISIGVEPSKKMAEISRNQGINVLDGLAENLPLDDSSFDYVLMVTAICFFDDVEQAFNEAYRVLNETGILIIALIDRKSELGKLYSKHKKKSRFYKDATFYSVNEIIKYS